MLLLKKIISGGQTGTDQAGLKIGHEFGYITGGFAPIEFYTADGPNRQLLQKKYGLVEYGEGYVARTTQNVKESGATMRLAVDFNTAGEKLILSAIEQYKRPYVDINLLNTPPILSIYKWLLEQNVNILNIAGNTNGTNGKPIFNMAYKYLFELFTFIKEKDAK